MLKMFRLLKNSATPIGLMLVMNFLCVVLRVMCVLCWAFLSRWFRSVNNVKKHLKAYTTSHGWDMRPFHKNYITKVLRVSLFNTICKNYDHCNCLYLRYMCIRTYNDIQPFNTIHRNYDHCNCLYLWYMCVRTYNDIPNEIIHTHTIWYLILVETCLKDLSTMSFIKN